MKIAIIGAGNSGCAQSIKLMQNGHQVNLIKTSHSLHDDNFDYLVKTGKISCLDTTDNNREFSLEPSLITRDLEKGLEGTEVVMILTQSLQHRDLASKIGPLLKDGQIVFLIPGNMGSTQFAKYTKGKHIIYVEGESTPYDARIIAPGKVEILFKNVRNAVSFLHKEDEKYLPVVTSLFGTHKFLRTNIIESTLHNPNMVVHTIGAIMSASRIEYAKGEFWMYRESFSPSIWNMIEKLDEEKKQVIRAYGGENAINYLDACKWRNEEDLSIDSLQVFRNYAATGGPKGPDSLNTRYIYEDVPMELCMLEKLAAYKGIATPIASALITIASALKSTDYRKTSYDISDIKDYI
ncbi:MAG: NAD/NADP octopine/nopaline dehydrogenase family protein [Fibrobacter sp.]|nr:NAD/NADP octopine/nopaline dehydrogenase family protein [Fibrobacter sp.]